MVSLLPLNELGLHCLETCLSGSFFFCYKPLYVACPCVLQDNHIALHLAVRRCQIEVVKCLLSHHCYVDHQDRHGNTPLHIACKDTNLPLVALLCAAKANLDIPNKVSWKPVQQAHQEQHVYAI